MEITWYGQTCFRLAERGLATVLTDPYPPEVGLTLPRPRADIITISRDDPLCAHTVGVRGPFRLVTGPGEYEIGGVFVTGVATFADTKQGSIRGQNTIFTFNYGELALCHLGCLGHVPTQSQLEAVGTVDILLVPVGGGGSLSPTQAVEVISLFEPGVVIPMNYKVPGVALNLGTLARFLKEMGLERTEHQETLKVSHSDISEETQVVVLEYKQRNGG
jgi:L-ascorbate metabolism protein UlaG (beta-lactamase superfamily)